MHRLSLPPALLLAGCVGMALGLGLQRCAWAQAEPLPAGPQLALPQLTALGLSLSHRPRYPGAADSKWSATPNVVLRWGQLTISNGGTLASRAGEPAESGLSAELFSLDRLSVRAALRWDDGRRSGDIATLVGLHDIPAHLRGRLQAGWRLHPQWELLAVWRADLSGRDTGHSAEMIVLHEWRPDFMDQRRWRVSAGVAAQWSDARLANLVHGVTAEDAARSAYPVYGLDGGWTDVRVFANWRRQLDGPWVAYGSLTADRLVGQAAASPIVRQRQGLGFSVGLGRRF